MRVRLYRRTLIILSFLFAVDYFSGAASAPAAAAVRSASF